MLSRSLIGGAAMAVLLTLGAAAPAMADVTPSEPRPAAPAQSRPSNYELGEKAAQSGDYARALPTHESTRKGG